MDKGIKGIQFLRHLMRQLLGVPDMDEPTPIMNNNPEEANLYNEVSFHWIPGSTNPSDPFTKEENDIKHFCTLPSGSQLHDNAVRTIWYIFCTQQPELTI